MTTHALSTQARGVLEGACVLSAFNGPIIGPDVADHFEKDDVFYRFAALRAGVAPENCLTVDDSTGCILGAKSAGLHTVQLYRKGGSGHSAADFATVTTDTASGSRVRVAASRGRAARYTPSPRLETAAAAHSRR